MGTGGKEEGKGAEVSCLEYRLHRGYSLVNNCTLLEVFLKKIFLNPDNSFCLNFDLFILANMVGIFSLVLD